MIRVTIEMLPGGQENHPRRREIGRIEISNDVTGSLSTGNYNVKLLKSKEYSSAPGVWRRGRVEGFDRVKLGPYDLLYQALKACVAGRNK